MSAVLTPVTRSNESYDFSQISGLFTVHNVDPDIGHTLPDATPVAHAFITSDLNQAIVRIGKRLIMIIGENDDVEAVVGLADKQLTTTERRELESREQIMKRETDRAVEQLQKFTYGVEGFVNLARFALEQKGEIARPRSTVYVGLSAIALCNFMYIDDNLIADAPSYGLTLPENEKDERIKKIFGPDNPRYSRQKYWEMQEMISTQLGVTTDRFFGIARKFANGVGDYVVVEIEGIFFPFERTSGVDQYSGCEPLALKPKGLEIMHRHLGTTARVLNQSTDSKKSRTTTQ